MKFDFRKASREYPIPELLKYQNDNLAENYHPLGLLVTKSLDTHLWVKNPDGGADICMMDGLACYGAGNPGHLNETIVKALREQTQTPSAENRARLRAQKPGDLYPADIPDIGCDSISRGIGNDKLALYAKALSEYTGYDRSMLSSGGAESVETALKLAARHGHEFKGIPDGQQKIITANGAFHGRTATIVGLSDEADRKRGFGIFKKDNVVRVDFGDLKQLKAALESDVNGEICSFLVEPIQGEAGIIIPPDGYIEEAYALCKEHGVLFVLDEIQSGYGRTGQNFAFQHYGIKPDVLITGKAMSGGLLPVSAVFADNEEMSVLGLNSHGSTFGGNPIASAVGLATLQVMQEDDLAQRSLIQGDKLLNALRPMVNKGILSDVRGQGLWIGLDLSNDLGDPASFCKNMAFNQKVFCKYADGKSIRLAPPLIINDQEIDQMVRAIYNTAYDLKPSLKPQGWTPDF